MLESLKITSPSQRLAECLVKADELRLGRNAIDRERILVKRQRITSNYLGWTESEITDMMVIMLYERSDCDASFNRVTLDLLNEINNLKRKIIHGDIESVRF